MTNSAINPKGTSAALVYSQGILSDSSKILHVSGQVGVGADGKVPADVAEQCRLAWANLMAVLETGGMGVADLVKVTTYLTSAGDIATYRASRGAALGTNKPASTLVVVGALADPAWRVEIEAVAVR